MANKTLTKNIVRAAADLEDIQTAIHEKGVDIPDGTSSSDYGSLIRDIQVDETDLQDVVRFDEQRNINLTGEGNIILDNNKKLLGTTGNGDAYNLAQMRAYTEPTDTTLPDLQLGDNLRGKTIIFTGTDLPVPDNNTLSGHFYLFNADNSRQIVIIKPPGIPYTSIQLYFFNQQSNIYGYRWNITEIQIPDDDNYFVSAIPQSETIPGHWGWENVRIGNRISQVELGSADTHSNVNSADRPTWESASGKKSFAMLDDLIEQQQNLINTNTDQDISALKTFTTLPRSPHSPTNPDEFANKQYVDDQRPVFLTQAEYDALGTEVQTNNVIYLIK